MPEYIWNGVGLTAPDGWEPSALERDGLLLEQEGQPVCELKWKTVQGTFSFEKHLKRLTKQHKSVNIHGVEATETPLPWQESATKLGESGLRLHSFIWRTPSHKGIGAALHNPATGLALLVQFFIDTEDDEHLAAEVLATLRDYSGGKTIPWAMFGLAARLPKAFLLDTFSFKPGHYLIKFWQPKSAKQAGKLPAGKGPGLSLTFERFAPASVLLKKMTLATWVQSTLETAPPEDITLEDNSNSVAWLGIAKTSLLRRTLRREVYTAGQVWTPETANAVMAVSATGTLPISEEIFTSVCESYELA